jgi:hypothetical protein
MIEGYWLKEVYYFYSKKEAIKNFKNLKKEMQIKLLAERLSKKIIRKEKEHEPFLWNNIRVSQEECAHG